MNNDKNYHEIAVFLKIVIVHKILRSEKSSTDEDGAKKNRILQQRPSLENPFTFFWSLPFASML